MNTGAQSALDEISHYHDRDADHVSLDSEGETAVDESLLALTLPVSLPRDLQGGPGAQTGAV